MTFTPTRKEVGVISADLFKQAISETQKTAFNYAVEQFVTRCNTAIKSRIDDFRRSPQKMPDPRVIVQASNEQTADVLEEVRRIFAANGYKVSIKKDEGYDDGPGRYTPPSTRIEITV
jgi:hypothetical protein